MKFCPVLYVHGANFSLTYFSGDTVGMCPSVMELQNTAEMSDLVLTESGV